jgi:pilus assembly protein Flp/PilA
MNKLFAGVKSFVREEDAPTMVEYGLMVALIAVACIVAATALGLKISALCLRRRRKDRPAGVS